MCSASRSTAITANCEFESSPWARGYDQYAVVFLPGGELSLFEPFDILFGIPRGCRLLGSAAQKTMVCNAVA